MTEKEMAEAQAKIETERKKLNEDIKTFNDEQTKLKTQIAKAPTDEKKETLMERLEKIEKTHNILLEKLAALDAKKDLLVNPAGEKEPEPEEVLSDEDSTIMPFPF